MLVPGVRSVPHRSQTVQRGDDLGAVGDGAGGAVGDVDDGAGGSSVEGKRARRRAGFPAGATR
ncbi:MAG TPA: hypothetical protein VHN15_05325, partial [Thermoanaerobaculia bacterium]|nr:hypothetical protein [Thermoanaerobaculia bacterium]